VLFDSEIVVYYDLLDGFEAIGWDKLGESGGQEEEEQ